MLTRRQALKAAGVTVGGLLLPTVTKAESKKLFWDYEFDKLNNKFNFDSKPYNLQKYIVLESKLRTNECNINSRWLWSIPWNKEYQRAELVSIFDRMFSKGYESKYPKYSGYRRSKYFEFYITVATDYDTYYEGYHINKETGELTYTKI